MPRPKHKNPFTNRYKQLKVTKVQTVEEWLADGNEITVLAPTEGLDAGFANDYGRARARRTPESIARQKVTLQETLWLKHRDI